MSCHVRERSSYNVIQGNEDAEALAREELSSVFLGPKPQF